MGEKTTTQWICGHCGKTLDVEQDDAGSITVKQPEGWGRVQVSVPVRGSSPKVLDDLCTDCVALLREWMLVRGTSPGRSSGSLPLG